MIDAWLAAKNISLGLTSSKICTFVHMFCMSLYVNISSALLSMALLQYPALMVY